MITCERCIGEGLTVCACTLALGNVVPSIRLNDGLDCVREAEDLYGASHTEVGYISIFRPPELEVLSWYDDDEYEV
jgi:hypothetical protein